MESKKKKQKKTEVGVYPLIKCADHRFIIQNLDVVALKLGIKIQFINF
jgi:hypothetical protein